MGNGLEKLIDKLAVYEVLNTIVPGTAYVVLADRLTVFSLLGGDLLTNVALCYFSGLVIGRVGSLVVEWALTRKHGCIKPFVQRVSYKDFVKAERRDGGERLRDLSSVNSMYRSLVAAMACLVATMMVSSVWGCLDAHMRPFVAPVLAIALAVLFAFAYRKQTDYIRERVERLLEDRERVRHDESK